MYNAPIIKKAIDVLRFISQENRPLGVTEVSKALSISKSTTYGILKAFTEEGLIRKDTMTKQYSIGSELMRLAKMIFNGQNIVSIARPFLENLSEIINETVFLGIRDHDTVKIIDVIDAKKILKISSPLGTELPITAGATGKLFLSTMKNEDLIVYLKEKGLPKYTENSITDTDAFIEEIEKTRKAGCSTDIEEYLKGVNAIATLIYRDKHPIGAIWSVGFSNSLTSSKLKDTGSHLRYASEQISIKLSLSSLTDKINNMIMLTHHTGEPHGILGAQAACTFMAKNLNIPSMVVGIKRGFSPELLLKFLEEYYRGKEKIICFSHLCGRKDIIEFIGILKENGFSTILGGPQARQDYYGEEDADLYPARFDGLKRVIDVAFHGPVDYLKQEHLRGVNRCLQFPWGKDVFLNVDWSNIYTFSDKLEKLDLETAQVLNAIGCPHAKKKSTVSLDPPEFLKNRAPKAEVESYGCVFCDVARDKGFQGYVDQGVLLAQIRNLPEKEGRKIAFELIDEYPILSLVRLLESTKEEDIKLTQINLVCRVDDINNHNDVLYDVLKIARQMNVRIMFSSIGFESFSDKILKYFNKGITVQDIVQCVETLRKLKDEFPDHLLYRTDEGANHGFIHPTPWDDSETAPEMDRNIFIHRFYEDVLPQHSTPLIIHHASCLGDWIRYLETETDITFKRDGTWIEWWSPQDGSVQDDA